MQVSEISSETLAQILEMLEKQVSKEERWWANLTHRERKGILKLSHTNSGFSRHKWKEIAPAIRFRIINTALKASQWVSQILDDPNCLGPGDHE